MIGDKFMDFIENAIQKLFETIEDRNKIIKEQNKIIEARNKQVRYLVGYVAGLIMPTQLNALAEKLKEMENHG